MIGKRRKPIESHRAGSETYVVWTLTTLNGVSSGGAPKPLSVVASPGIRVSPQNFTHESSVSNNAMTRNPSAVSAPTCRGPARKQSARWMNDLEAGLILLLSSALEVMPDSEPLLPLVRRQSAGRHLGTHIGRTLSRRQPVHARPCAPQAPEGQPGTQEQREAKLLRHIRQGVPFTPFLLVSREFLRHTYAPPQYPRTDMVTEVQ